MAIALAVDGLNSIDAKSTTAREASKWILAPWESITLDGWQTSASTARRFFFTSEQGSYGAWLGKTKNLGVISAVVFREKCRPAPVPILENKDGARLREDAPGKEQAQAGAPAAESRAPSLSDELAATGIGRELGHEVRRSEFDPEDAPAARLELRYEYRAALARLGVVPPRVRSSWEDPLARRERARGFEDSDFAPDPYRRSR